LPEPTQAATKLAYLLYRVADTLEDAERWPRSTRLSALAEFCELLSAREWETAGVLAGRWLLNPPTTHEGYLELLRSLPGVLDEVHELAVGERDIIFRQVLRTARGMSEILEKSGPDGHVQVSDLAGLRSYCYLVAGIVGELLTELFIHDSPELVRVQKTLVEHQAAFGEGLQLVNILKDEHVDRSEGRSYLDGLPRADVMDLARSDLVRARIYIDALKEGKAPAGFIGFTLLAEELAQATLAKLEHFGAGAKISRAEVVDIFASVQAEAAAVAHSPRASNGK
jgi:farnesyl-diphosphate farnesyltransferase